MGGSLGPEIWSIAILQRLSLSVLNDAEAVGRAGHYWAGALEHMNSSRRGWALEYLNSSRPGWALVSWGIRASE
jgi:hypothetical protein